MATQYPGGLDNFSSVVNAKSAWDPHGLHFGEHVNLQDAIVAIQTAVGAVNYGAGTVGDGNSTEVVTHGLGATPSAVVITPQGNATLWVTAADGTGFTVNRTGSTGDLDFYWQAAVALS